MNRIKRMIFIFLLALFPLASPFLSIGAPVCFADEIEVDIGDYGEGIDGDFENSNKGNKAFKDDSDELLISGFTSFLTKYRMLVIGVFGMGTLTMFIIFIWAIMGLAAITENPKDKYLKAVQALLCFVGFAILGGITIIVSLFFNVFR